MKTIAIVGVLALVTAGVGLYAALLWLRSSKIVVIPTYARYGGVEQAGEGGQAAMDWIDGVLQANQESSDLNRKAARWTALSVALGAITTIIGVALPLIGQP